MPGSTNEIDVLIGTDCISEGQNLQDCDYLVNYLGAGKDNEFIAQIRERDGFVTYDVVSLDPPEDGMTCKSAKAEVTSDMIVDFYQQCNT